MTKHISTFTPAELLDAAVQRTQKGDLTAAAKRARAEIDARFEGIDTSPKVSVEQVVDVAAEARKVALAVANEMAKAEADANVAAGRKAGFVKALIKHRKAVLAQL